MLTKGGSLVVMCTKSMWDVYIKSLKRKIYVLSQDHNDTKKNLPLVVFGSTHRCALIDNEILYCSSAHMQYWDINFVCTLMDEVNLYASQGVKCYI